MANIPNERVYEKRVSNNLVLNYDKRIAKLILFYQIMMHYCHFIFFNDCLRNTQCFHQIIPIDN
jgi:hypothetical protein